jgi:hypothetical protein
MAAGNFEFLGRTKALAIPESPEEQSAQKENADHDQDQK